MKLFNKHFIYKLPVVTEVGSPQEIKPPYRLWGQVQPDLAGAGEGRGLSLYDLTGSADQLDHVTSCLVLVKLEHQAVRSGIRIGPETG